jgi:heme/copper-type cytochrome/quinol oxidase subunit 4
MIGLFLFLEFTGGDGSKLLGCRRISKQQDRAINRMIGFVLAGIVLTIAAFLTAISYLSPYQ